MNNLIIVSVVIVVAIVVGIMGSSNYDEIYKARDHRNLQITIDDCKRLFSEGSERDECIGKSINTFGTDEQKRQWEMRYSHP
ncbi:MAG: hypothetical protein K5790_07275 [Nitrosopumilus sp.]|uniref:hypothetical protein n=1 Tax=Nitrosopumilus sp. TaxID=2024843 RepID=UPI00247B4AF2|nr:hypothetical protein [Nitrosopumilus sp.]MCV0393075.1 hypothetical protein [Nitrosopumilus sp.]